MLDDESIECLRDVANLELLHIGGCPVTDRGTTALSALQGLRMLDLSNTGITNTCITTVEVLNGLRLLVFSGTEITMRDAWPLLWKLPLASLVQSV